MGRTVLIVAGAILVGLVVGYSMHSPSGGQVWCTKSGKPGPSPSPSTSASPSPSPSGAHQCSVTLDKSGKLTISTELKHPVSRTWYPVNP